MGDGVGEITSEYLNFIFAQLKILKSMKLLEKHFGKGWSRVIIIIYIVLGLWQVAEFGVDQIETIFAVAVA